MKPSAFSNTVQTEFRQLQDKICKYLTQFSESKYCEDKWEYKAGKGGGRTRVWENDPVWEKAGVNFSGIVGDKLPDSSGLGSFSSSEDGFLATGISLVIHPRNPWLPTIHMNVRYFETPARSWFGGGIDLTPYFPELDHICQFHQQLESICNRNKKNYLEFKRQCDEYFYLPHRKEARGVGGIFFDRLSDSLNENFRFVLELAGNFPELYNPFVEANWKRNWEASHRDFQLHRRSRYAEFNLVYDRGTKFGLQSGGRIDSILMSLPREVKWHYKISSDLKDAQEKLEWFLKARNWLVTGTPEEVNK